MSYCINPNCPKPSDPSNENRRNCRNCGTELLLQGRYRVLRPLGGGGFGQTFEVDDQGTVKVLKVLLKDHPKAVSLFQQEAAVLACLRHPGIPKVDKDAYFTCFPQDASEPVHCLVMEKIEGLNLQDWLKERDNQPITQALAMEWLKQLADILDQVHQQNYFHRDIKPNNIMRRPDGQLALIDFGTAREVTGTYLAKVGQGQNVTGIVSPGYTPPEQVNGKAVPQSDFFALGRTFVYLLTGKSPNEFPEDPRSGKLIWRDRANHIGKSMADVIDYLMAPFPGKRPQNAQMILQCLAETDPTMPMNQSNQSTYGNTMARRANAPGESSSTKIGRSFTNEVDVNRPGTRSQSSSVGNRPGSRTQYGSASTSRSGTPNQFSGQGIKRTSSEGKSKNKLLAVISLLIVGLLGTQVYGYFRYGLLLSDPIFLVSALPSSIFLARSLFGNFGNINCVAITPDNQTLVAGTGTVGKVRLWNLKTGQQLEPIDAHFDRIGAIAISPNGQKLVTASDDKSIKIWDLKTGARMLTRTGHTAAINAVAISPNGKYVVTGSNDQTTKIWDFQSGDLVETIGGHSGAVLSVAISPDSQTIVTGTKDKSIQVWDFNTGKLRFLNKGLGGAVFALAFSPDGKTLASGIGDNKVIFWKISGSKFLRIRTLAEHSGAVLAVAFSPDGKYLVSAGNDNTVMLWEVSSGKLLRTLVGHEGDVTSVAISHNGKTLVSGSQDSTIKVWQMP